jgi:hypothetical protein
MAGRVLHALLHASDNYQAQQAQRVTGCAAPHSGLALTQRRATTTRSLGVGNLLADLPSGERQKTVGRCMCWIDGAKDAYPTYAMRVSCRRWELPVHRPPSLSNAAL